VGAFQDEGSFEYPPGFNNQLSILFQQLAPAKNRGAQLMFDSIWKLVNRIVSNTNLGDANSNLDVDNAALQILPSATLSANRIYTAPAPAAARKISFVFSVMRFDTTANTLQYKDGPSGNVIFPSGADAEPSPPYQVDLYWDGTNWSLAGYSPLAIQT
jgi:hypothetical protein